MESVKKIQDFSDGLIIEQTPNYTLVYGYKPGMEGQEEGERTFLVPKNRPAEKELLRFAIQNENALTEIPFGKEGEEEIKAIRFNGDIRELLDSLHSDEGLPEGPFGGGIPSLSQLEAKLRVADLPPQP